MTNTVAEVWSRPFKRRSRKPGRGAIIRKRRKEGRRLMEDGQNNLFRVVNGPNKVYI